MSVFSLKIIAVICMICDHIRYIDISLDTELTKMLGRVAFPLFAFLISEGCIHTKNIKKYMKRLLVFAFISQIPYSMFCLGCNVTSEIVLNIFFTLFLGALAIQIYQEDENYSIKSLKILCIILCAELLNTDYGFIGVLTILNFYIFKDKKIIKYIIYMLLYFAWLFTIIGFDFNIINGYIPYFIGYLLVPIFLQLYNGKLGRYKIKYFFYIIYPLHLLVLLSIHSFI